MASAERQSRPMTKAVNRFGRGRIRGVIRAQSPQPSWSLPICATSRVGPCDPTRPESPRGFGRGKPGQAGRGGRRTTGGKSWFRLRDPEGGRPTKIRKGEHQCPKRQPPSPCKITRSLNPGFSASSAVGPKGYGPKISRQGAAGSAPLSRLIAAAGQSPAFPSGSWSGGIRHGFPPRRVARSQGPAFAFRPFEPIRRTGPVIGGGNQPVFGRSLGIKPARPISRARQNSPRRVGISAKQQGAGLVEGAEQNSWPAAGC